MLQVTATLGDHTSELRQQPADLIALRGPRTYQSLPRSVQCQERLLLGGLDRHKPHVRATHRLTDRLRIAGIVLVRLHVRLDELRGHQLDRVTQGSELAGPKVRTAASLHTD